MMCATAGSLTAQLAYAQAPSEGSGDARKIFIAPISAPVVRNETDIYVGDTIFELAVNRPNEAPESNGSPTFYQPSNSSFSAWSVEPAGAAIILGTQPISPATADVDVQFLEATTVTITVRGFDNLNAVDESSEPGFNEVVYIFNVQECTGNFCEDVSGNEPSQPGPNPLTRNQRTTQTAFNRVCAELAANDEELDTDGQANLRNTCDTVNLQSDMATSLDRLAAEEVFAMGDALLSTADHQISNLQSRIRTVREGRRESVDISALNLQLWDQSIGGSVLQHGKSALTQFTGGGASSDVLNDSPIGFFVNGNIAFGSVDGDGIQRDANINTNSLSVGADYRINANVVVGTAIGVVNDDTDFDGNNGDLSMSGFSLSGFGTWYEQDLGYADIVLDISQNELDLKRRINLPGQNDEFAISDTDASRVTFAMNAGKTFQRGATEFGPTFQLALTRASIDGFDETSSLGNGIASSGTTLQVDEQTITSTRLALGAEARHVINTSKAVFVPSVTAKLQIENETDKDAVTAHFISDTDNNDIDFIGNERDSSVLLLSVGTTAVFRRSQSAFFFYDRRAQDDYASSNRLRVGYRVHF